MKIFIAAYLQNWVETYNLNMICIHVSNEYNLNKTHFSTQHTTRILPRYICWQLTIDKKDEGVLILRRGFDDDFFFYFFFWYIFHFHYDTQNLPILIFSHKILPIAMLFQLIRRQFPHSLSETNMKSSLDCSGRKHQNKGR